MPPQIVPLIGSSFDALNAQRYNWMTGYNRPVEEANRASYERQVDRTQGYFRDVAQMAREDAMNDARLRVAAEQEGYNRQIGSQTAAEQQREFDIGTQLKQQELAGRTAGDVMRYGWQAGQEKDLEQGMNRTADFLQPRLQEVGTNRDKAFEELAKREKDAEGIRWKLEPTLPAGEWKWDDRSKRFMLTTRGETKPKTVMALNDANRQLDEAWIAADQAQRIYKQHADEFKSLWDQAMANKLVITQREGKYVVGNPWSKGGTYFATPGAATTAPGTTATKDQMRYYVWQAKGDPKEAVRLMRQAGLVPPPEATSP